MATDLIVAISPITMHLPRNMIDFAHSSRLWFLLVLIPLGLWAWRSRRLRIKGWQALGQSGSPAGQRSWLVLLTLGLSVIALAEPRGGRLLGSDLPPGRDVVFVVDVSKSMAAEDAVPNRLGVAVETGRSLVRSLSAGDRAAVVVFAGRARLRCPLTENLGAVEQTLRSLRPGEIQPGGSDLGQALSEGLAALGGDTLAHAGGRSLVLISDGEDHAEAWPAQLVRLETQGVVVTTIGVGEVGEGSPIPTEHGPLMYESEHVKTRRVDGALAEIAATTGGVFLPVGLAAIDLGAIDRTTLAPASARAIALKRPPEPAERFGPVVLIAVALLLLSCWPARLPRKKHARAVIATLALMVLAAGPTVADLVAEGQRHFVRGELSKALIAFEQARSLAPTDPIVAHNLGATLYRLDRFREAQTSYLAARVRAESPLRIKLDYALGNVSLRLGDPAEAVGHYISCLAEIDRNPKLNTIREDVRINKAFAEDLLKSPKPDPESGGQPGSKNAPTPDEGPPPPADDGSSTPTENNIPPTAGSDPSQVKTRSENDTPEARLQAAVVSAKRARSAFRLTEPSSPPMAANVGKDW